MNILNIIQRAESGELLDRAQLTALLSVADGDERDALFAAAYRTKLNTIGPKVYFRGIIEFSNRCAKDCYYCGIRRSNVGLTRFKMTADEIVAGAKWAMESDYGSLVLQSGEIQSADFCDFVENILLAIRKITDGRLGITLSLGEQSAETYARWFAAGAHRYLLRVETSDRDLYARLHPRDHRFEQRVACLDLLRLGGWQVGTGVMIGLPWQTMESLAQDIVFFRDKDVDMVGMGPYIPHAETPLAASFGAWDETAQRRQLELGLRMIAVTRLALPDINIAATTALQALDSQGRELGIRSGANVIMPNVTDTNYRSAYQLYDGKPCLDENAAMCRGCLQRRVEGLGETIGFGEWGDSPHFHSRMARQTASPDARA